VYFFIGGGAFFTSRGEQLAALALRYAVPTANAEFCGRTGPLTMASPGNGSDYAVPAATEGVEFDWNDWLNRWLDNERSVMIPWIEQQFVTFSDELFDAIGPHLKKTAELELQVAQLRGTIDVLRQGPTGQFQREGHVRRRYGLQLSPCRRV